MKKHGRLMFGITKRTRFAVAMVVVALVLMMALGVLGYVGVFGQRSELCTVAVTNDRAGDVFGGTGINCDVIPNINLVRDASFESSVDYSSMLVAGASEGSIFLTPDAVANAGYNTTTCAGDTARIISIDSEGVMSEKFTGTVTGFKPARLGVLSEIKDEKDLWDEDRIKNLTFYGNTVIALTENGRIIYEVTNSQLTGIVDCDERFAMVDSNDSGVVAVALSGSVYMSQDAKNYALVYDAQQNGSGASLCGTGCNGQTFAVCYSDGTIVTITNGKVALTKIPGAKITAFVSDGTKFMATNRKGEIYSSSNGTVFNLTGSSDWLCDDMAPMSCAANGIFCFIINNSRAVIVSPTDSGYLVVKNEIAQSAGAGIGSAYLTDSGLIIVGTADKKAFAINLATGKSAFLNSENIMIEKILGISGDKVYYDSGKDIYKSQILSEFSVEGNLEGVDIIADDILIMGHAGKAAGGAVSASDTREAPWAVSDEFAWDVYGNGTNVIVADRAYSGRNGAKISGSGNGVHAMTQSLPGKARDNFMPGTFYRLSLYALSDSVPDKVYCWVEGDGFGRYGFELTQIGGNYKRYSYVFAVTDQMADAGEIRLNIAFEGTGHILVDDIYLGPDSYDTAGVPQYYSDTLASGKPDALRLNNLNIGSSGYAESSLYLMSADSVSRDVSNTSSRAEYNDPYDIALNTHTAQSVTNSLEDSLRLVKQCGSSPWIVIGPYVNQSDIDRFMEYICGSLTSDYGGKRIDNGTALPWSRQFTRFYIEIKDSGKVFKSDIQKASYVNYVISMFTQSEYFSDIKDKTVFLDGMVYDGGTMMSDADNHTMDVKLIANDSSATYIDNINTSYVLAQYKSPHVVSGNNSGEYINTLDTDGSNCAKIISAIMTTQADYAEMFLFDASVNFVPSKYTESGMFTGDKSFINMVTVSGLTTDFTGFDELYIDFREPLDPESTASIDQFMSNVTAACFSKGNKSYIVIANSSNTQQSFLINDTGFGRVESVIKRFYDDNGRLINEKTSRNEHLRHILQPGEFIIIEVTHKS